ncbi:helix-turn-helix domain-containing protein [Streptomyces iakyrus]|uniref:Helix-turn-helix domain-containing protein n=1 Tax=Streptomyces iakyrus TaxID=68219 RepID=A0ABW8FA59_9ACTN
MGRPEGPIAETGPARRTLALWLRSQRESASLSYEGLAARTTYSPDTMRRAASGQRIPTLKVLVAFAEACGADLQVAEGLWKSARRELSGPHREYHIAYVIDFPDLHDAMQSLYRHAGSPSYSELDRRAGGNGRLAKSTLSRFFAKKSVPSKDFTLAFAVACGVRGEKLELWEVAWLRAAGRRASERRERIAKQERGKRLRRKRARVNFRIIARCVGCHRHEVLEVQDPAEIFWCSSCEKGKIPLMR